MVEKLATPQNKACLNERISRTRGRIPLEEKRHSVGGSWYNLYPTDAYEQYGQTTQTQRQGYGPIIPADPEPYHSGHRGSVDSPLNGCRIPISYEAGSTGPTQAYGVPFLSERCQSTSVNGMISGGDVPAPHTLHHAHLGSNRYTVTDHAPLPRGRSGGTSNTRVVLPGDPTLYSLGIRYVRDQEFFSESPYHSTRVQRPRSGRRAKEDMNFAKAEPSRRHARGNNTSGHQPSTTLLPMIPSLPRGPEGFKMVVQTQYSSATRQDDWTRQSPIEFGWLRLTNAENPKYMGIPGHGDRVFDYQGIGGSILCRLNFSGQEIGRLRVSTTNHRTIRESITKKKLALEVAKFVKRYIETIKAQPDHNDVTFENAVLTRLCHVSKASWQPELWYETTSGHESS